MSVQSCGNICSVLINLDWIKQFVLNDNIDMIPALLSTSPYLCVIMVIVVMVVIGSDYGHCGQDGSDQRKKFYCLHKTQKADQKYSAKDN